MLNIIFSFLIFAAPSGQILQPLGLPWGQKVDYGFREYRDYRYIYGDVDWGTMSFYGFVGETLNSELVLTFSDSKLSAAYLILGPKGLSEKSCLSQYKRVVDAISKKYGKFKQRETIKESIMEDLVFVSECYAISVGVAEVITKWEWGDFRIEASLFSEDGEIFIEVEYVYVPVFKTAVDNFVDNF